MKCRPFTNRWESPNWSAINSFAKDCASIVYWKPIIPINWDVGFQWTEK